VSLVSESDGLAQQQYRAAGGPRIELRTAPGCPVFRPPRDASFRVRAPWWGASPSIVWAVDLIGVTTETRQL